MLRVTPPVAREVMGPEMVSVGRSHDGMALSNPRSGMRPSHLSVRSLVVCYSDTASPQALKIRNETVDEAQISIFRSDVAKDPCIVQHEWDAVPMKPEKGLHGTETARVVLAVPKGHIQHDPIHCSPLWQPGNCKVNAKTCIPGLSGSSIAARHSVGSMATVWSQIP